VFLPALLYSQLQPPPPKICGSPGGPPITGTRTRLKDGRYLAYLESGVPKEQAKYKIIFVHGFDSCRYDALPISPVKILALTYLVHFSSLNTLNSLVKNYSLRSKVLTFSHLRYILKLGEEYSVFSYVSDFRA
jgi:hypothetical protein